MLNFAGRTTKREVFYIACFAGQSLLRSPLVCLIPLTRLLFASKFISSFELLESFIASLLLLEPGSGISESQVEGSPLLIRYLILAGLLLIAIAVTSKSRSRLMYLGVLLLPINLLASFFSGREFFSFSECLTQLLYLTIIFGIATRSRNPAYAITSTKLAGLLFFMGNLYSIMSIVQYMLDSISVSSLAFFSNTSELKFFPLLCAVVCWYILGYQKSLPIFSLGLISLSVQMSRTAFASMLVFFILCTIDYFIFHLKSTWKSSKLSPASVSFFLVVCSAFIWFLVRSFEEESQFKTLSIFFNIYQKVVLGGMDLFSLLNLIDPVRSFEFAAWQNSGIWRFIFGSGLGSGISLQPLMNLPLATLESSFSSQELSAGVGFGFHDVFTWYGISIGLIGLVFAVLPFTFQHFINSQNNQHGKLIFCLGFFLVFINSWYSLSGVLLFSSVNALMTPSFSKRLSHLS